MTELRPPPRDRGRGRRPDPDRPARTGPSSSTPPTTSCTRAWPSCSRRSTPTSTPAPSCSPATAGRSRPAATSPTSTSSTKDDALRRETLVARPADRHRHGRLPRADRRRGQRAGGRARLQPRRPVRHRVHGRERPPRRPARRAWGSSPPTAARSRGRCSPACSWPRSTRSPATASPRSGPPRSAWSTTCAPTTRCSTQAMACAHRIAKLPRQAVEDTKRILNLHLERAVLATLDFALDRRGPLVHLARAAGQHRPPPRPARASRRTVTSMAEHAGLANGARRPRSPVPRRGLVGRCQPRRHGGRGPGDHGRRRVPRPVAGPPWRGTFADVDRPPASLAASLRARGSGRATSSCSSCRTGWRPASRSGRAAYLGAVVVPIVHFYGAKEVDYILRATEPDVVVTADRFGYVDYLAVYDDAARRPPDAAVARRRRHRGGDLPARGDAVRDAARRRPDRRAGAGRPRRAGDRRRSRRARRVIRRASSTRTARSASRPASSTTCSPAAGRRRSPARRSATSSGWSTPSSSRCCATGP